MEWEGSWELERLRMRNIIILRHPSRLSGRVIPWVEVVITLGLSLLYSHCPAFACWVVFPCTGTSLGTARMYFSFLFLHLLAVQQLGFRTSAEGQGGKVGRLNR